jgi:hypothetical protein
MRLLLPVSGELKEDVMVFGQEPCNSGRRKRRSVAYLGLLPPPIDGQCDIMSLYRARYGEPKPGMRVFIVTCQQKDGWKGIDRETDALVPERPKAQQAVSEPSDSHTPHMHKGSARDAQRQGPRAASQPPGGNETETGGKECGMRSAKRGIEGEGGGAGTG